MTANYVAFISANILAGLGWLLLLTSSRLPRWVRTVADTGIPALLSVGYLLAFLVAWPFPNGGFDSPENLARLFSQPQLAMTGWIHYLAFDLLIGGWQLRRAERQGMSYFLIAPCLVLTMLFGPIGLLAFLAVSYLSGNSHESGMDGADATRLRASR